jgi:hypothetical protein
MQAIIEYCPENSAFWTLLKKYFMIKISARPFGPGWPKALTAPSGKVAEGCLPGPGNGFPGMGFKGERFPLVRNPQPLNIFTKLPQKSSPFKKAFQF